MHNAASIHIPPPSGIHFPRIRTSGYFHWHWVLLHDRFTFMYTRTRPCSHHIYQYITNKIYKLTLSTDLFVLRKFWVELDSAVCMALHMLLL